jgi:hypothetical protein
VAKQRRAGRARGGEKRGECGRRPGERDEGKLIPSPVGGWPRCRRSAGHCRRGHARADTPMEREGERARWAGSKCTVHLGPVHSGGFPFSEFYFFSIFCYKMFRPLLHFCKI